MKDTTALEKLNLMFNELKSSGRLSNTNRLETNILCLAQMAYDAGDRNAFKFAEQDLKMLAKNK